MGRYAGRDRRLGQRDGQWGAGCEEEKEDGGRRRRRRRRSNCNFRSREKNQVEWRGGVDRIFRDDGGAIDRIVACATASRLGAAAAASACGCCAHRIRSEEEEEDDDDDDDDEEEEEEG
jgi:hypothetical protein